MATFWIVVLILDFGLPTQREMTEQVIFPSWESCLRSALAELPRHDPPFGVRCERVANAAII